MSLVVVHLYYYGYFVTVNTSTANNIFYLLSTMTKTQLHEEYSKTMKEAQDASGRREMMDLFKLLNLRYLMKKLTIQLYKNLEEQSEKRK